MGRLFWVMLRNDITRYRECTVLLAVKGHRCYSGELRYTRGRDYWMCASDNTVYHMMTSSNGYIFCVTGLLRGDSTCNRWIPSQKPVTRSFDVFFDLRLNKRFSKQLRHRWFGTPSHSLWRHYNVLVHILWDILHINYDAPQNTMDYINYNVDIINSRLVLLVTNHITVYNACHVGIGNHVWVMLLE